MEACFVSVAIPAAGHLGMSRVLLPLQLTNLADSMSSSVAELPALTMPLALWTDNTAIVSANQEDRLKPFAPLKLALLKCLLCSKANMHTRVMIQHHCSESD